MEQTEGDADMARSVVDSTVKDKEVALKKLESSNPKPGTTVAEKIAAAKEHKAAIEAARQELEQWKAIAEVENSRKAEAKAEAERKSLEGVNLSEEKDENGNPLVLAKDGTTTFGEVRDESGLPAAPIKLSVGYQDKNGRGYGLTHIEANHGAQIKKAGFASVEDFISYVAQNYDENNIKVGKHRKGGSITYLLQVTDTHDNTLFIELSRDGSYWNVNSAGVFRKGYSDKKETVAKTEPQQPSNAISERASQSTDQSNGIMPASSNGKPTVSAGKVSESSETKQEKAENSISAKVKEASADVNTEPTEAQKEEAKADASPKESKGKGETVYSQKEFEEVDSKIRAEQKKIEEELKPLREHEEEEIRAEFDKLLKVENPTEAQKKRVRKLQSLLNGGLETKYEKEAERLLKERTGDLLKRKAELQDAFDVAWKVAWSEEDKRRRAFDKIYNAPLEEIRKKYWKLWSEAIGVKDRLAKKEEYDTATKKQKQTADAVMAEFRKEYGAKKEELDASYNDAYGKYRKAELEREKSKNAQETNKRGAFGTIYTQFKGKAKEAIAFLLKKKEGEAVGALHHKDIGDIALVWGNEKAGLQKIAKKHPEVLDNLQEIIDDMHVSQSSDNRIILESDTHKAVVSKEFEGKERGKWLLTAYEKKKDASGGSIDIAPEPKDGKQNGTAPLQDTVSAGKVKESSETKQEKAKENIDDAKIDAVLGALDKGDEKAVQLVSELTNKELSEARSKAKPSSLLEEEWQRRAQNRGGVSLHDWLLENQYVEPAQRVSGTFRITDYIAPKKSLYADRLGGVLHDKSGFAVASDGRILVTSKDDFDPKLKGKVVGKDGAVSESKFPDWRKVIPPTKETKSSNIGVEDLHKFVAGVLKANKRAFISLRFPDGTVGAFNANRLNLMLHAMKRQGANELLYAKDGTQLVAKSEKGAALLMGLVSAEDELVEDNGYAYPGNTVLYHRGEVVSEMSPGERVLRDAVVDRLRESGMEVISDEEEGQRVLDEANGKAKLSAKKRRALETASVTHDEKHQQTVISSADGTKVLKNLDSLVSDYEKSQHTKEKTFLGDVAKALGAKRGGSASEYATFETKNGRVVTIRLSNHNATVSNFDANGETDGISIVVSPKKNAGIANDGNAHVVEYYYDAIKLRRAEGKPLADIVRSIKQALYSGEFEDTTGLAERQEVNVGTVGAVRFFRTANGKAYGFTVGGKIYIDPGIANSETPIHEYAHLWAVALRGQNPKEWKNIVSLMKGTSVWDEVKKRYPELNTDDDIADEVLATYSGRRGAERLREEQRKIAGGGGSMLEKAEAVGALESVKQALRKFWKGVADFLHIHYESAEDVADRVMKDMLDGVDPSKHSENRGVSPRFQFIGERGATAADNVEEALTRQNNLDVARRMEEAKKDARTIKLATGWERGADGKWRYEIPDGIFHPKGDAELKKALAKQPWSEELNSLSDRILNGENLSEEETKRFNELAEKEEKFKAEYLKKEKPHLADWLENDELFKAYPELKCVGIVLTDQLPKEQGGYYDSKSNAIAVNTNFSDGIASVIAHEVQHAIQRYEGFATGGNIKTAIEYLSGNKRADVRIKQQLAYEQSQKQGLGLSREEVDSLIGHLEYEDISDDELQKQIDDLCQKHNITEDQLEDIYPLTSAWQEAYNRISGEVESRNVQKRMGMSEEERRQSPAADTEDVARDSQILLFGGEGKNMRMESPKSERIEKLRESRPVEITGEEYKGKYELNRKSAKEWLKNNLRGEYIINDTGETVELRKDGIQKVTSHSMGNDAHLKSLVAIPQMIENSIFIDEVPNEKNNGKYDRYRYYVCGLKIGGVDYTAKITIGVKGGYKYYDHSLTQIEKGSLLDNIDALSTTYDDKGTTLSSVGKDSRLLSILQVKDEKNPSDELYREGEKKELRDGRQIEFVRKPTATYNALVRHLEGEGVKPDLREARTGSRYMSFEKDGVEWEVRSSDHTKPGYYGEAREPAELTYYKDKQGEESMSVNVDLGTTGYGVEDMKALMEEVGKLKNDTGETKEAFDKGVVSDEAVKRYPLLSRALGVKSETEVRAKEEARKQAEEAHRQAEEAHRQAEEEAKAKKRGAVESLSKKLHLDNVEIIDEPAKGSSPSRRARAKGFYVRSTGRITINIGNCRDVADVVATLLHEAVAHYGLRKLFGKNFDTFLDNVYNSANAEIRRIIAKHAKSRYGGDLRIATEEYLASLAERTDFENARERNWWQKIKSGFLEMLGKTGIKGFGGVELTDNELRYMLWRSYENLKNGGKDTLLSEARDVAMQSELGVGEFVYNTNKFAYNAEEANERFNEQLADLTADNADNVVLSLGSPSKVLLSAGVEDKPMKLYGNKVVKKMRKHGFALDELRNLPLAVANPIAVFNNYGEDGNRSILTELKTRQGNFLVSVNIGKNTDVDFNIVTSVFGKGDGNVADWINKGYMTYVDKEKALNYLHHSALRAVTSDSSRLSSEDPAVLSHQSAPIAATAANAELSSAAKVVENFENPKPESENDVLFRDGDAKDYEKAQARETYERRVNTGMFQSREAIQDSMLSLKVAMDAIEEATAGKAKRIEDYDGFENAYLGENRLSSVNQAESAAFAHLLIRPMMEEVNRLAPTAEARAELIDYMFAKHGLERNAYMRQQAAEKKLAEYKKQNPGTAKTAADFIDAEHDYAGLTTLTGKPDVSAAESEAQRMVADYENEHNADTLWQRVNDTNKAILSKCYESGLMSKDVYEKVRDMYVVIRPVG